VTLREQVIRSVLHVSLRHVAVLAVAAAGGIALARTLGAAALGLYAVAAFAVGIGTAFMELGLHQLLLRARDDTSAAEAYVPTLVTVRAIAAALVLALQALAVAPWLSAWYASAELYWLVVGGAAGAALSSFFRISISLLERDLRYKPVGVVEVVGTVAFYGTATALVLSGVGVVALAVGDVARGASSAVGFVLRPFPLRPRLSRAALRDVGNFGTGFVVTNLTWLATSGLNPIVVGGLAGLEAAGLVRVADGIVGQVSGLKGIVDRVAYPTFARIAERRAEMVRVVNEARMGQFLTAVVPLSLVAAVGPWLIPLVYGAAWAPVATILPFACFGLAMNTTFGLFSPALITVGHNLAVARFHVFYVGALWCLTPVLVAWLGYLGLAVAGVLATPAYWVLHRAFVERFGTVDHVAIAWLTVGSTVSTWAAWSAPAWPLALAVFAGGHLTVVLAIRPVRDLCHAVGRQVIGQILPAAR
jgi:PST family polysaccharide transporter